MSISRHVITSLLCLLVSHAQAKQPNESEKLAAFCEYERVSAAISEKGNNLFDFPNRSLSKGEKLKVVKNTSLMPMLPSRLNAENRIDALASIKTVPSGMTVLILDVHDEKTGKWYKVQTADGHSGYFSEGGLMWMNTPEAEEQRYRARKEWVEPRYEKAQEKIFTSKGLNYLSISSEGFSKGWLKKCK